MSFGNEDFEESERPLYSPRRRQLMRVVVSMAILALVLPGVLITWATQLRTANYACQIAAAYYAPEAQSSTASFQVSDPDLFGWNCYAQLRNGNDLFVGHLGVIPGAPRLVPLTGS
jgi:hypothetical protein